MSAFEKTIIPLINSELELENFNEKTGFIGAYVEDIDRPYLDNHVFLLYKWDKNTENATSIFYKLKKLDSFHSYKTMYIDGKPVIVYTFTSNRDINHLKRGGSVIGLSSKLRILQFWKYTDDWVNINVMRGTIASTLPPPLPIEDYLAIEED